ncbi:MAG: HAD family phosphatase [Dehalococcoidales bacterium]|nr:HAD family phosphatase [Dehalococcoidales bacterium]
MTDKMAASRPPGVNDSQPIAVIWDMDGVIADTAAFHFRAWQHIFRQRDTAFTEDDFQSYFGQRDDTIVSRVLGDRLSRQEVEAIAQDKEAYFRQIIRQNVKSFPGSIKLIKALKEQGFRQALASSAPAENIALITSSLGVTNCFDAIVSGREVKESKPSPQVFLLAAQKLGVGVEKCLVIEDSVVGATAAKAAGMYCLAVTNTHPRDRLSRADFIIDSLGKITPADIKQKIISQQSKPVSA